MPVIKFVCPKCDREEELTEDIREMNNCPTCGTPMNEA